VPPIICVAKKICNKKIEGSPLEAAYLDIMEIFNQQEKNRHF
jgi:hypothetical protein